MVKKKSIKDQKKLEELKSKIEKQLPEKKEIEIEKPKKKTKKDKLEKSKVRKKRDRKIKEEIIHEFVPKHSLLTEEEKEELSQKLNVDNLTHILISDPGIRHLEVKPGSIIKINRTNPKIGDVLYYRLVVKG